jgi:NodT family efflux transporter outer membrane factor (OMF) lipoprotein
MQERHRQVVALLRQRVEAGLDNQSDLAQADAARLEAATQLEVIDEQTGLARRQLAVLSGQAPDALDALEPVLQKLPLDAIPHGLGTDLLGRRADVVAARWRVEAATQDVALAQTQFYPNLNLGAFVGLQALGLGRLLQAGSLEFGVAPALRLPLFDGGRLRQQLGVRQADLDAAIAQYNSSLLEAVREAGDALQSESSLLRQQQEQAATVQAAERILALARQRFAAGLGNRLAVLQAEAPVLEQHRKSIELRARQLDNRVVLIRALGGGWSDDTAAATTAAKAAP